tara:strand:+ start:1145 stop:1792 length:648 start_codon:yes stop_codon:yes gene_type:complete
MKKQQLKETNAMRRLMGLELIAEGEEAMTQIENAQKMAEARALKEKEIKEGEYIDEKEDVEGVDAPESAEALKKDEEDHGDVVNEDDVIGTGDTGASDEAGAPESEEGLEKFDKDEIFEDSEGEETYNYGDDEGHDHKEEEELEHEEEMAPADRVREIERHLDALKKDMGYDEDHEDRDEEGTHFAEGRKITFKKNGNVISLSEGEIKKLSKLIK